MTKESVHFQAKLHPSSEYEAYAIKILEEKEAAGYTRRQILSDALNRLGENTPEMFTERDQLNRIEQSINQIVSGAMNTLLKALKQNNRAELKRFVDSEDDEIELEFTDEFIRNAKKAVRPSFRQSKDE